MRLPIPFVAVALALIAVGATAAATEPSGGTTLPIAAGGTAGGVLRASVVCPDLRIIGPDTLSTTVAVGTANPGAGSVVVTPAATANRTGVPIPLAGQQPGRYAGPITGALELQATGSFANSLVAEQASRGTKTADRGWSEVRCESPRAEQWFVGAATTPGNTPVLELVNPTDAPAVVDVSVLTPDGVSQTKAAHNLSLTAHSVVKIPVADLAPNAAITAVRVSTRSGRASAAVLDTRTAGLNLNGTDWVPMTSPAVTQTITGIPAGVAGGTPGRWLIVGVPGDVDAHVQVQIIGKSGTFPPVGAEALATIPAGTVRAVDLSKVLGVDPGGVIVTSSDQTVPIVSSLLVDVPSTKNPTIREITYLGPNVALQGAAVIPFVPATADIDSVLILSTGNQPATVTVIVTDASGATKQSRLTVESGTTRAVSLRDAGAADGSLATVVPDPGSSPIYATRLIEENGALGPLISSFALVGPPSQQKMPPVVALPLS